MSETPTWETVREAISMQKKLWPGAGSWKEIQDLEKLVPKDPSLWATSLPEDARSEVLDLVRRIAIQPVPRPYGRCDALADWVGIELKQ